MREKKVKNKVRMHWNSDFCKQSQCNYVHIDEDYNTNLQGKKFRYRNLDIYRADSDRKGQTGTYRDRQGQTRKFRDIQ